MQVRNLASTMLTRIRPRLPDDWQARYGYRPVPLETFVQSGRFAGTSYCAANLETVAARKPTYVDNYVRLSIWSGWTVSAHTETADGPEGSDGERCWLAGGSSNAGMSVFDGRGGDGAP